MNEGIRVPGGYLLHSPEARTLAAKLAAVHTLVIGIVIAIVAVDMQQFDLTTIVFLVSLVLWAPIIPMIPWGRLSHNWLAKIYLLGAGSFIFFAYHFDNPYLLLGIYPEMFAFADIYWYRRSMVALHLGLLLAAFVSGALLIGGAATPALILIAAPLMTVTALLVGAMSQRFIRSVLQRTQFQSAVTALLEALHARDGYTGDHSKVTLAMAAAVSDEMDLDEAMCKELADVALLHDIGKVGIPNSILQKPGALTDDEWKIMRQHPVIGEQILAGIPGFESVAKAVRHEHERWDGGGYPDGLCADEIPLASRIVLTCDAYHAMTSDRPYRKAMDREDALRELRTNAGTQFDPEVVDAFERALASGALAAAAEAESTELTDVERELRVAPGVSPFDLPTQVEASVTNSAFDDPKAMIAITCASWTMTALVMGAYLAIQGPVDWIGGAFTLTAAAFAVTSFLLRGRAPKAWTLYTGFAAYVMVPVVAMHFEEPAMITFLLGPALTLSGFFWHRIGLRAVQIFLVLFEFVVLPVLIFGGDAASFAAVSARAFPGALLIVGFFSVSLSEMSFERQRFAGTMSSLLLALQARDGYTAEHSDETVAMALLVADHLGLDENARMELKDVALLHDIGKMGIPDEILHKPGPLNDDEWLVMRQHPVIGEQIVGRVPGFEAVATAIRHEHERWDGGGYPDGLKADAIPFPSRVVLACDAFHAMTSDRPYRKAMEIDDARAELVRNAGTQFDPAVVNALLIAIDRMTINSERLTAQPIAA